MAKKAKKRGPGRKGYAPAIKAKILAAAKKENLTGAQVAKRFGISTLTFYKWRGPMKGRKAKRGPGRPAAPVTAARLRQIVREEVARALRGRS